MAFLLGALSMIIEIKAAGSSPSPSDASCTCPGTNTVLTGSHPGRLRARRGNKRGGTGRGSPGMTSWDADSFAQQETAVQEITQKVHWKAALVQRRSVVRQVQASTPSLVFPDFLEEVQTSCLQLASVQSVSKHAAPLAFLKGAGALDLVQFPLVDSTIVALVQAPPVGGLCKAPACPKGQCRITEAHLKNVYAAKAQVTCLVNTAGLLTAYLDGILRLAPLHKLVASELRLVSGTLMQIS
ncbi:UNVERIFIED_CONTAM: hypothetical protein FKN15_045577 [Acipenser sinensis]